MEEITQKYLFDVAFSYAGEQRGLVKEIHDSLQTRGIKIFYDGGQITNLWGKDLYQYLSDIYQNKAQYCVVFLSRDYANKLWTKHELKAMQARAFKEAEEYILPIKLDDTEIAGLLPTVAYIKSEDYSVSEISDLIYDKIRTKNIQAKSVQNEQDSKLEIALADSVLWAEEYLKPQPLGLADQLAQAVRKSFKSCGVIPSTSNLKPYILNDDAAFRVVGYLAYQIQPFNDLKIGLNFVSCLSKEKLHAQAKKETRPLWQLLVCMHFLLTISDDRGYIKSSLKEMLLFLESDNTVDTGHQCKQRIRLLLAV